MNAIRKFLKEEDGVTALEYGILAALVAAALIGFSTSLKNLFNHLWDVITNRANSASA